MNMVKKKTWVLRNLNDYSCFKTHPSFTPYCCSSLTASHCRIRSAFLPFTLVWSWLFNHGNTSSITWEANTCTQIQYLWNVADRELADQQRGDECAGVTDFFLSAQQLLPGFIASSVLLVKTEGLGVRLALVGWIVPGVCGKQGLG